ncbi:hypothetical protein WKH56_20205 [Priestia sp. SB1]|uniref:hypothetical protein n=1 Tax=Priestia sp. SB1 TaxID=3132359 RepID=UPI003171693D
MKNDLFERLGIGALGIGVVGGFVTVCNNDLTSQINNPLFVLTPVIFAAMCLGISFVKQIKKNAEHDLEFRIKAFVVDQVYKNEQDNNLSMEDREKEMQRLINYIETTNMKNKESTIDFIKKAYVS